MKIESKMLLGEEKGLPSDYQQVEYLESTGTQYLKLNYIPNRDDTISFEFYVDTSIKSYYGSDYLMQHGTYSRLFYSGSAETYYIQPDRNSWNTYLYNGETKKLYFNDKYASAAKNNNCTKQLCLFLDRYAYSTNNQIVRFKNFEVKDKIKLVSCVRVEDNKPGMYDLINEIFYTNQAEGEDFVVKYITLE